jgi:hypothetical protein
LYLAAWPGFAPIRGSRFDGEQAVVLAVSKDQVKDAPQR